MLLTDLMSEESKQKIAAYRERIETVVKINVMHKEQLDVCKLGFYYGWEAIKSFENNEITIDEMKMYIKGAEKIHAKHVYDMYVALGSIYSDELSNTMNNYINEINGIE